MPAKRSARKPSCSENRAPINEFVGRLSGSARDYLTRLFAYDGVNARQISEWLSADRFCRWLMRQHGLTEHGVRMLRVLVDDLAGVAVQDESTARPAVKLPFDPSAENPFARLGLSSAVVADIERRALERFDIPNGQGAMAQARLYTLEAANDYDPICGATFAEVLPGRLLERLQAWLLRKKPTRRGVA